MWFMKSINWSVITALKTALKTALAIVVWLAIGTAKATPIMDQVSGRVLHFGGTPVVDAQVSLFDLNDLRQGPVAQATTDGAGYFTLSLAGLQNQAVFPDGIGLGQNYPNPFNPATIIPYQLAEASHVRIEVFNVLGQLVATLVDAEQAAGSHIVRWDARDASGRGVAAGVYLYRFTVGDITQVRRMVLLDGKKTPAPIGGRQVEAVSGVVDGLPNPIYGLVISGQNMVSHVVSDFQLSDSFIPMDIVIDGVDILFDGMESEKSTKVVAQSGILGDADLDGQVTIVDALLVAMYSANPTAISISSDAHVDVNCDGQVDIVDAWLIGKYSINPNDSDVRRDAPNIGTSNICSPASLSPDPSTVTFDTNGTWHRFTIQSSERVIVVANPSGTTPLVEISASSGESNLCPPEQNDEITRNNGESIYLSGCGSGTGTVELRRASDNTLLNTYTFSIGVQASLSPDPSTVMFDTNGTWHRFTIQSSERVIVVANPSGTTPLVEITTTSGARNLCPAEQDDDYSGNNGEFIYLSGCGSGTGTVELRRASDNTVLNTYTFSIGTDSRAPLPTGITYVNNRFYEVDHDDDKVYVYNSSGQRVASADFNLDSNNGNPQGITYANNRFYVVDHDDDKVYVYNSSGQRVASADFDLDSNNGDPIGITYANNRFYVVDWIDDKVYVYNSSGQRVSSADFNLDSNNGNPEGITYANNRFYVVDWIDDKVYVYNSSGQRDASADFNLDSNNDIPTGITYTNGRLYVADRDDDQIYSYDVSGGGGGGGSPDLIVESPSVSNSTLTTGQSFTLQATVRNQGTGQSAATTLRYYQSVNATISVSDTRVGSAAVGSLNASSSSVESISLNAPSSSGTYYYGACVSSVSGESKTNNNCSVGVRVTVSSGGGTTVTIPDVNLRAVITDSLGKARGAPITRAEMASLTRLSAPNSNISDLTGLEVATGLTRLELGREFVSGSWVNSNEISDLSPLSGLTNLTYLDLTSNSISDISALSNLTNLTGLFLFSNSISDVSALSNLTNLTYLSLSRNSISDVSALSNLTNLTVLYLYNNSISDVSALSNLTNLTVLYLDNNSISDVSALSNLTNLTELGLRNNSISDVSALSNLTNLTVLYLDNNSISDVSALSNLTNLTVLYLYNNSISDVSALSNLTNLTRLYLDNNNISNIAPLAANTGLGSGDEVDVRNNPLSATSLNTHIPTLQGRGVNVRFGSGKPAVVDEQKPRMEGMLPEEREYNPFRR